MEADVIKKFKEEIIEYVKYLYSLILEEHGDELPEESLDLINNFDYEKDIIIDDGGKYSKGPARWEKVSKKLHLSPRLFYENTFKNIDPNVEYIPFENIMKKIMNSANESFSGEELSNLVKQTKLSHFDITKSVVIHELFHSIISLKTDNEFFPVDFDGKIYDCKGVKGEFLDEGLVEYYARRFANKYELFLFPSIPYQINVEFAKKIVEKLGKNANRIIFNGDYKMILNYIHEPGFLESYINMENEWLKTRITERLKIAKEKDEAYNFENIEELELEN